MQNADFSQINLGSEHGCGIGIDSHAYCWGSNNFGRLGIGSTGGPARGLMKTNIDGPYFSISAGPGHTCVLRLDNSTMNCWGFNVRGQTGQLPSGPQTNPLEIVPTDYTYSSNELRVLHSRNSTPMNASQLILPSRTIVGGIDRDNQFYGPFVFEVVIWL